MKFTDTKRLVQILETFAYSGLAYYLYNSKLHKCVSLFCRIKCWYEGCFCPPEEKSLPVYFRRTLEKLGPTFIKLGQLLSVRPDFIPSEYSEELRKLQDKVQPFSFKEAKEIIESEWKSTIEDTCSLFNKKPIASASIAQVHEAKLKNGQSIAIKVQRPNVIQQIHQDLRVLEYIANYLEEHWPASRPYRPKKIFQEFAEWTAQELDFRNEATLMSEIRRNFKGNRKIIIPEVHWNLTGKTALTMKFIKGCNIYNDACLKKNKINKKRLALTGAESMLAQTIIHGIFHGDPHPGNLIAVRGNKLAYLDFGITGRLSTNLRKKLLFILSHLVNKDFDTAINHVLEIAETTDKSDIQGYRRKIYEIFSSYYGSTLEQNKLTFALFKAIIEGVHHQIYFSTDLVLFSKTLVTTEGVGALLNPKFNLVMHAKPFIEQAMRTQLSPLATIKRFIKNVLEYREVLEEIPVHAAHYLRKLEGEEHK